MRHYLAIIRDWDIVSLYHVDPAPCSFGCVDWSTIDNGEYRVYILAMDIGGADKAARAIYTEHPLGKSR